MISSTALNILLSPGQLGLHLSYHQIQIFMEIPMQLAITVMPLHQILPGAKVMM